MDQAKVLGLKVELLLVLECHQNQRKIQDINEKPHLNVALNTLLSGLVVEREGLDKAHYSMYLRNWGNLHNHCFQYSQAIIRND